MPCNTGHLRMGASHLGIDRWVMLVFGCLDSIRECIAFVPRYAKGRGFNDRGSREVDARQLKDYRSEFRNRKCGFWCLLVANSSICRQLASALTNHRKMANTKGEIPFPRGALG